MTKFTIIANFYFILSTTHVLKMAIAPSFSVLLNIPISQQMEISNDPPVGRIALNVLKKNWMNVESPEDQWQHLIKLIKNHVYFGQGNENSSLYVEVTNFLRDAH